MAAGNIMLASKQASKQVSKQASKQAIALIFFLSRGNYTR